MLSVPGAAAQGLCDKVVECGVRSILSFAPVVLQVPEGVNLRKVDLATELQILPITRKTSFRASAEFAARKRPGL